jgi:hypothetical protein
MIGITAFIGWMKLEILKKDLYRINVIEESNTLRWEALDMELRNGVISFCERHFPCDRLTGHEVNPPPSTDSPLVTVHQATFEIEE